MVSRLSASAVLVAVGVLLAGCDVVKDNTSCPEVPALRVETPPRLPVNEKQQIWQPGQWEWDGRSFTWREGRWILHTGQSGLWMPGHFVRDRVPGPCRWVPAHWQ